ncbi:MAG: hypothetical protein FWE03_00765 [Firmicutes bacterium]|nr:hypothetical protein [Bacillota bacterium]
MESELKKRALLAKQRMKMGYWQDMMKKREAMINKAGNNSTNLQIISQVQRADIIRDANIIINNPQINRDESLYNKVKAILDEDEFVTNPIGKLIENDMLLKMDDAAKQKYILDLSQKYRELKERYYKERIKEGSV